MALSARVLMVEASADAPAVAITIPAEAAMTGAVNAATTPPKAHAMTFRTHQEESEAIVSVDDSVTNMDDER
jgi:hypothetical protein